MPSDCTKSGRLDVGFYRDYERYTLLERTGAGAWSFEALVVAIADEIAQRHHDVEDGLRTGAISKVELLEVIRAHLAVHFDREDRLFFDKLASHGGDVNQFVPYVSKLVVGLIAKKVICHSVQELNEFIEDHGVRSRRDFKAVYPSVRPADVNAVIGFSPQFSSDEEELHSFLKDRILNSFEVQRMDGKGRFIIRQLFKAYVTNVRQLHDSTIISIFDRYDPDYLGSGEGEHRLGRIRQEVGEADKRSDLRFQMILLRCICDHVSGMTDAFAMSEYAKLYG
jgi:dGTPase